MPDELAAPPSPSTAPPSSAPPSSGPLEGDAPLTPSPITTLPLGFSGSGGEYFRVWIVNVLLSVLTLGLYIPWARVRTRQYFCGHTWLDGHNFEYTARPAALLRGYLVLAALFVTYSLSQQVGRYAWVSVLLAGLFFALYPYLVYRSLRFNAANTVYRGLSFQFHGRAGAAYLVYLLALLSVPFTLGLSYPAVVWLQRRYLLQNLAYGTARSRFEGDVGPVYSIFLVALGMAAGAGIVLAAGVFALFLLPGPRGGLEKLMRAPQDSALSVLLLAGAAYGLFLLLYGLLWQYLRAALLRYSLHDLYLGDALRLRASFSPLRLAWIGVTNTLAQLASLGLLTPWATVRRSRYLLSGVQVQTLTDLESFSADLRPAPSAFGEAAHEFFNFDLGF